MPKVLEVKVLLTGRATGQCTNGHPLTVVSRTASLQPFVYEEFLILIQDTSALFAACPECTKTVVPSIPQVMLSSRTFHIARDVRLDCGHTASVRIEMDSPAAKQIPLVKVDDNYSCSECSSDKAIEMEVNGEVDVDSATRRYHAAIEERRKNAPGLPPLRYLTEEQALMAEMVEMTKTPSDVVKKT